MNNQCNCHKKVTRNFAEAHNNECPQCHKILVSKVRFSENPPSFGSPEKDLNQLYQNNQSKPDSLGLDNLSFTNLISGTNSHRPCDCPVKPSGNQFCSKCEGTETLYSNIKSENYLPTNSFSHETPQTSLDLPNIYEN